jgi:DNA-binding MarR family transcriptional regulator
MTEKQDNARLAADLRMVISRLIKKLRVKSAASGAMSLTERSTLSLLDQHKELLPSELAAMEKITSQSMSQVLNHLLELGYILRRPSATDKRKVIISLSKSGQEMLHRMRHEREEWLQEALDKSCTARERDALRRALVPLTRLVDFE